MPTLGSPYAYEKPSLPTRAKIAIAAIIFLLTVIIGGTAWYFIRNEIADPPRIPNRGTLPDTSGGPLPPPPIIVPPPPPSSLTEYRNDEYGFSLMYRNDFVVHQPKSTILTDQTDYFATPGKVLASFAYPVGAFASTTYQQAYGTVAIHEGITTEVGCKDYRTADRQKKITIVKNRAGVTFYSAKIIGAAAGTLRETHIYHRLYRDRCFELNFTFFKGNIANYEPGTVVPVNEYEVWIHLETLLDTIQFYSV